MSRTYLPPLALAVTMLAVTGGCGGSKPLSPKPASSQSAHRTAVATPPAIKIRSGTALTHARWVASADVICARLSDQLAATRAKSLNDLARVLPQVVAYERTAMNQLSQLVPPKHKATTWQKFLATGQLWLSYTSLVAKEVLTPGFTLASPLAIAGNHAHESLMAIAKQNGLKDCAKP